MNYLCWCFPGTEIPQHQIFLHITQMWKWPKKIQIPTKGHNEHHICTACYQWLAGTGSWKRSHNATQHIEVKRGTTLKQSAIECSLINLLLLSYLICLRSLLFKYDFSIRGFALEKRPDYANIKCIRKENDWLCFSQSIFPWHKYMHQSPESGLFFITARFPTTWHRTVESHWGH